MKIKPNHFQSLVGKTQITRSDGKILTIRDNRMRFFFPDEWLAFFDQLKLKQKITFHFLINTGMRINEARHVKVQDIDFDRQNIVITQTKSRNKDGSRRIRVIKISTQFTRYLRGIIKTYKLKNEDYIPILSTPAANIGMKKALEKAGIKDYVMFSVHTVRKSIETWLIALDIDSMKIANHFGHSIVIAAKHYISPDIFSNEEKLMMRKVVGDLYEK